MLMNYVVLLTYLLYLMLSETNDCSKLMNTKKLVVAGIENVALLDS